MTLNKKQKVIILHDKENNIISFKWGKGKTDFCEELNLDGCTIIYDLNKKGTVIALEVLYYE